ncbi:MAG: hypothetical protein IKE91_07810 [Clostridia bacterium]|nr:hypothetical protein [Clostridia bacterium]
MASIEGKTVRQSFYETTDKEMRDKYDLMYINRAGDRFLDANKLYTDLNTNIGERIEAIGLDKRDLPKPSVSAYNKIIEIYREYKNVGLSIAASPLIDPLIKHLTEKMTESQDLIEDFSNYVSSVFQKKCSQLFPQPKKSALKRFFSRIKSFFASMNADSSPMYSQEDIAILEGKLDAYESKDREIQRYCIDRDLIPYITEKISQYENVNDAVEMVNEIEEELMALGYKDCIPNMKETIRNAFSSRLSEQDRSDKKTKIDVSDDTEDR